MPDHALEQELAELGRALEWPSAGGLGSRVVARLADAPAPGARRGRSPLGPEVPWAPVRRSVLLAAALALALAAVVAAAGLLLPGLRIVTVPPGTAAPPAASLPPAGSGPATGPGGTALGATLGLGTPTDVAGAEQVAGFRPRLPEGRVLPPPAEVYAADGRVTLLWPSGEGLPETEARGVGLLVTQLRGRVDEGWYEKQVVDGGTRVEPVSVAGNAGYWLSGRPHALVYRDAGGRFVEETRRVVGDVLIWRENGVTFRIEGGLGRDAAIALAGSFATGR